MPQTPCHTPGGPGPRAALPGPRCQGLRPWGALGWGSASGASSALGPVAPQLPALRSALVPMTLEKHGQQVDTLDQAGGGQGKRRKGAWHPSSPLCTPSTFSGRRKLARLAAPPRECSSGTPIRAPKEGVGPGPPRPAVAEKEGIFCSADLFEGHNAQTAFSQVITGQRPTHMPRPRWPAAEPGQGSESAAASAGQQCTAALILRTWLAANHCRFWEKGTESSQGSWLREDSALPAPRPAAGGQHGSRPAGLRPHSPPYQIL